jgi:hypothetical protein
MTAMECACWPTRRWLALPISDQRRRAALGNEAGVDGVGGSFPAKWQAFRADGAMSAASNGRR